MAAFAGALTLGSCKDDDDDVKPAPAPEPEVIDTVPFIPAENYFAINGDSLFSGDTIKANTLLNKGANSDSLTFDVVLRNETVIDSSSLSFSFSNDYLGKVNVQGVAKFVSDSSYTVKFPAIEGNYTFSVNGIDKQFKVVGTGKELSKTSRFLSNKYSVNLNANNKSICGIEFVAKEKLTIAHIKSSAGKFISLIDEKYNEYVSETRSDIEDDIEDITTSEDTLTLEGLSAFAYIDTTGKIYICKVAKSEGDNSTDVTIEIAY